MPHRLRGGNLGAVFGRHHSRYHVAGYGLPGCRIGKLRSGVLFRLRGSLQYPSRGPRDTDWRGLPLAFANDGWKDQMPWQL